MLPALRKTHVTRAWAGMTGTVGRKNRVGLLGREKRLGQFYVVVASGLGFTLGPVLGRLAAELVGEGRDELADGGVSTRRRVVGRVDATLELTY